MHNDVIFGVPHELFIFIIFFWITVAAIVFGLDALADNGVFSIIIVFFTIGTTMLIGHFGWQILILPSLVIISTAVFLVWRVFFK